MMMRALLVSCLIMVGAVGTWLWPACTYPTLVLVDGAVDATDDATSDAAVDAAVDAGSTDADVDASATDADVDASATDAGPALR